MNAYFLILTIVLGPDGIAWLLGVRIQPTIYTMITRYLTAFLTTYSSSKEVLASPLLYVLLSLCRFDHS